MIAALATAGAAASADAREWHGHRHHRDRIDAGDVIASVAIAGGIMALASAITEGSRARKDAAADACADEAEYRSSGHVTDIFNIRKSRGYYSVEGIVERGDGGADGVSETQSFHCVVRNGRIYSFRTGGDGPGS
jgi:hypothetical protein